jgi:hypothetical protein
VRREPDDHDVTPRQALGDGLKGRHGPAVGQEFDEALGGELLPREIEAKGALDPSVLAGPLSVLHGIFPNPEHA